MPHKYCRKFLKDVLHGHKNSDTLFHVGLKVETGNVMTYDGDEVGTLEDFEKHKFMMEHGDQYVYIGNNYGMKNDRDRATEVVCQHY